LEHEESSFHLDDLTLRYFRSLTNLVGLLKSTDQIFKSFKFMIVYLLTILFIRGIRLNFFTKVLLLELLNVFEKYFDLLLTLLCSLVELRLVRDELTQVEIVEISLDFNNLLFQLREFVFQVVEALYFLLQTS
jgi:hypothetical protein